MDPILFTPRLKLTLVTKAEPGSQDLEWLHELRSDEKAAFWSLAGRSVSIEDTLQRAKFHLPQPQAPGEEPTYRANYAVHELLPTSSSPSAQPSTEDRSSAPSQFIGYITLLSQDPNRHLKLPEHLGPPSTPTDSTPTGSPPLEVELAYMFLPAGWGKGYASESLNAVFDACSRDRTFWAPFERVWVRAIVNARNPASVRVMEKSRMEKRGVYVWSGDRIWMGGEWTTRDELDIYGMWVVGGERDG